MTPLNKITEEQKSLSAKVDRLTEQVTLLLGQGGIQPPPPQPSQTEPEPQLFDSLAKALRPGRDRLLVSVLFLLLGSGSVYGSIVWALEVSSFAFAVGAVAIALGGAFMVDHFGVREFKTFEEIKNGNIAAALYWLGLCALFGLALVASR
jgi:hypothetical protein